MRFLFSSLILFTSCGSIQVGNSLDSAKTYRMDLAFRVNGEVGSGVLVAEPAKIYKIEILPRSDSETLTLNSCHREEIIPGAGGKYEKIYIPTELESRGFCPLEVASYSKNQWYQGGLIIPKSLEFSLSAELLCNGVVSVTYGVSVCQARAGLIEQIKFKDAVTTGTPMNCSPAKSLDGITWEFRPARGQCVFLFRSKTDPAREHLLTTVGYDEYINPR